MHVAIYGMTLSGKSTLAKSLARRYQASGISVLVLDPLGDPSWPCDYRASNVEEFLETYWASRGCAVFFDEAGDYAGQHAKEVIKTATKGRHFGHRNHYITQRMSSISKTIRDQCSTLALFTSGKKDSMLHAEEWAHDELREAHTLTQGEYFLIERYGRRERRKLFETEK